MLHQLASVSLFSSWHLSRTRSRPKPRCQHPPVFEPCSAPVSPSSSIALNQSTAIQVGTLSFTTTFLYSSSFWQGLGTDSFWQGAMTVSLWQGSAWATWAAPPPVRAGGRGWGGFCLLLVFFITSTQHLLLLLEFFLTVLFSAFWQRLHPSPFCVLERASSSSLLLERASSSSFWSLLATASSSSFRLGKSFTLAFPSGQGLLLFFFLPFGKGFLFFLFLLFALFLFFRSFFSSSSSFLCCEGVLIPVAFFLLCSSAWCNISPCRSKCYCQ